MMTPPPPAGTPTGPDERLDLDRDLELGADEPEFDPWADGSPGWQVFLGGTEAEQ